MPFHTMNQLLLLLLLLFISISQHWCTSGSNKSLKSVVNLCYGGLIVRKRCWWFFLLIRLFGLCNWPTLTFIFMMMKTKNFLFNPLTTQHNNCHITVCFVWWLVHKLYFVFITPSIQVFIITSKRPLPGIWFALLSSIRKIL